MDFQTELESIRIKALDEQPFWALVAMKLELLVCTSHGGRPVETAATDGRRIFANPEYCLSLPKYTRHTLILHEVAHVALGHQFRRGNRDHYLWNIACDYVINLLLKDAGFPIPGDWYCDEKYRGWSEEKVFGRIVSDPPPPPPDSPDEPGDEPGNGSFPESGDGPGDEPGDEIDGGKPGAPAPPESAPPSPKKAPGEVWDATDEDGKELTEGQKQEGLRDLADTISQGEMAAKDVGKMGSPDERRALDRITRPKMDWSAYLAKWIHKVGKPIGRTWSRLDRRALSYRQYLPGEIREGLQHLMIFEDISSSVGRAEHQAFFSHLEKIRGATTIQKITIVPFNHVIQQEMIIELGPKEKLPTDMECGGGTNYEPIFHWLRHTNARPDAVIIFTDLECRSYGEPTRHPILWASSEEVFETGGRWTKNKPPFGDAVQIDI